MSDFLSQLAALRARREAAGLSRARLCGLVGCSLTTLANYESGVVPKHSDVLERVNAVLDDLDRERAAA